MQQVEAQNDNTRVKYMKINRRNRESSSDTETVEGPATALERVNDIQGGDSFPFGVLGVGYRVANDLKSR